MEMTMMQRTRSFIPVLLLLGSAAAWSAQALNVKLTVEDFAGTERKGDVVTTGVPFPQGAIRDVKSLTLSSAGRLIPAQFVTTVPWPDGSVRWALLDTQVDVPASGKVELTVADGRGAPAPVAPLQIDDGADAVRISTGPLEFRVSKKKFNLFESLQVDGREVLSSAGKGIIIWKEGGGEVLAGPPTEVKIENAGPLRATVCVRGRFPGVHKDLLGYTVRLTAYAGRKVVKMHVWFENDGGLTIRAPGRAQWFAFDGLALDFGLKLGDRIDAACEGVQAAGKLKVAQYDSPNYDWKSFHYKVTSGDRELKTGDRTDGTVVLSGTGGTLAVAIRHFWENYEKAIELDGSTLRVWLWPTDGEWPRTKTRRGMDDPAEYPQFRKAGVNHLPGATRKGHEVILDFSGCGAAAAHATLSEPLMARAEPAYYAGTEAVNGWFAPADFRTGKEAYDAGVKNWNRCARQAVDPKDKAGSLIAARQGAGDNRGFWYGWMDFGDNLWAEGYSSLHYDWTWIMLLQYMRTGERGFLDMGVTMARHRIDIDQIWAGDSQYYNNLTRYEKCFTGVHGGIKDGNYGPIPSHNWDSGMVLYYMLTGEPQAREGALNNYAGMKRRLIDPQDQAPNPNVQTRELGWSILNLCSLYDMTADRKYLDDAMILFNKPLTMQWKAGGPYLGNAGGNCLQYYYSTQALCELHQRTGDANVLKLLKEGCEGNYEETKPAYKEWAVFLSNIYAYVGYCEKNAAYIAKAEDLFCRYAEATKTMGCYSSNGAWAKDSGKLLRNGHILQYVEWRLKP
jgi:hypothetical protein